MTCKEFYDFIGGNYNEVLNRFMLEENLAHFLVRFLSDNSFSMLERGMAQADVDLAFRSAHTLKGIAQSYGFDDLGKSSTQLTEVLRKKSFDGAEGLFLSVKRDYDNIVSAIKVFAKE